MLRHYILDDARQPVAVSFADYRAWILANSSPLDGMPRVAKDVVTTAGGQVEVSTIFLGHDLSLPGTPEREFFETLIGFAEGGDKLMFRWATWDLAEGGHRDIVQMLGDGDEPMHRLHELLHALGGVVEE